MADKLNIKIDIEEMAKLGVCFGHKSSKIHPKMKEFVVGVKGSDHIHIIDLNKTKEYLLKALEFIKNLIHEKKVLLIVGTKPSIKNLVKEFAQECGLPYVNHRWVGGTLTNFGVIKKRIDYFKELERKLKEGELDKYTKKERLQFQKELEDLEEKFGGIKNLETLPDAIFIIDLSKEQTAWKEAKKKNIPIIAIVDTNADPTSVEFPIPANDDAISSVKYILEKVKEVIKKYK